MPGRIDHLVITGATLAEAADHGEAVLGLRFTQGGKHPAMGTHNRLLSLGPDAYVEAIAPDPEAKAPAGPRWFGLDEPKPPRLSHWVLRVPDMEAALAAAPPGFGRAAEMRRGDYAWSFAAPPEVLPFDGVFPALIAWHGVPASQALEDSGARLVSLTLRHPRAGALGWALSMLSADDRIIVREGPAELVALIHTEAGEVTLR